MHRRWVLRGRLGRTYTWLPSKLLLRTKRYHSTHVLLKYYTFIALSFCRISDTSVTISTARTEIFARPASSPSRRYSRCVQTQFVATVDGLVTACCPVGCGSGGGGSCASIGLPEYNSTDCYIHSVTDKGSILENFGFCSDCDEGPCVVGESGRGYGISLNNRSGFRLTCALHEEVARTLAWLLCSLLLCVVADTNTLSRYNVHFHRAVLSWHLG